MENKTWQCRRCGKCCKFISIPVRDNVDIETESYLIAHGIAYDGKKLIIPAVCQYLDVENGTPVKYRCKIHNDIFANCRLAGEKECKEAQKAWALLDEVCDEVKTT